MSEFGCLVTIIMPVYNAEKYLCESIESVINQSYKELEIILVNDGSTDDSPKICDFYSNKDNRIKVIHKKNGGVSSARNVGLENATGSYVSFLDSDDILHKSFIETFVKQLNLIDKNTLLVCNFTQNFSLLGVHGKQNIIFNNKYDSIFNYSFSYLWNKFYNLELIKTNNICFDESISMCEDMIFNTKYLNYVNEVVFLNIYNYYYRPNNSSISNNKLSYKWFSILRALILMFDFYNEFNVRTQKKLVYFSSKILIEVKYKIRKYCINSPDILSNVKTLEQLTSGKSILFSDKIKYFLLRLFPNFFIK